MRPFYVRVKIMNYATIKKFDIANGTGVRVSVFVSGCRHHCKNCFNSEAWDFNYGKEFDFTVIKELMDALNHNYIEGLSILGGEPFEPENQPGILELVTEFKNNFKDKNIWCYTGFLYEDLINGKVGDREVVKDILSKIDVLVDGKFVEELKDASLLFRGSSNQNIIDVQKSLKAGEKVILEGNWSRKMGNNNIFEN